MTTQAFLIGNGQVHELHGERGKTPPCPNAKFKRGDVVKIARRKELGLFPSELIVLVAIPPGFSPDDALCDLLNEPRAFMKRKGKRAITYLLCQEGDTTPYWCREKYLSASGKEPVEIGSVMKASDGN